MVHADAIETSAAQQALGLARRQKVALWVADGKIKARTCSGPISVELRDMLKSHKNEVVSAILERDRDRRPVWRESVAGMPLEHRERFGHVANDLELAGAPWPVSERLAFDIASLELREAEDAGLVPESDYPDPHAAPLLSDADAVAAIDAAFGNRPQGQTAPPSNPTDRRGPRDYRLGDRWLPWHFNEDGSPKGPVEKAGAETTGPPTFDADGLPTNPPEGWPESADYGRWKQWERDRRAGIVPGETAPPAPTEHPQPARKSRKGNADNPAQLDLLAHMRHPDYVAGHGAAHGPKGNVDWDGAF